MHWASSRQRIYDQRTRENCRRHGLCIRCHKTPARPGLTTCEACAAYMKRWREEKKIKKQEEHHEGNQADA